MPARRWQTGSRSSWRRATGPSQACSIRRRCTPGCSRSSRSPWPTSSWTRCGTRWAPSWSSGCLPCRRGPHPARCGGLAVNHAHRHGCASPWRRRKLRCRLRGRQARCPDRGHLPAGPDGASEVRRVADSRPRGHDAWRCSDVVKDEAGRAGGGPQRRDRPVSGDRRCGRGRVRPPGTAGHGLGDRRSRPRHPPPRRCRHRARGALRGPRLPVRTR